MTQEPKKLGELLLEASMITAAQLEEALRHQRIAGGRTGSNLVALGYLTEDALMDFLARKTGIPRVDLRGLDVPVELLNRIPRRLAEQQNILPIGLKEPKSLVLAMADPLDLSAIDSARFASGLVIEPVVASYTQLRILIPELYRKVENAAYAQGALELAEGGLPVAIPFQAANPVPTVVPHPHGSYATDPFYSQEIDPDAGPVPSSLPLAGPFGPFGNSDGDPRDTKGSSHPASSPLSPMIIHARSGPANHARRLDSFKTRTLVLGLIKLFQRRGALGDDELQRFISNLLETGELKDE